ncbi:MAG: Bcr/CflA family drug resistance efflux transporter [Gammaproteobacteria bacterium]|nr:Bcr/CflA family drug resistance efflux transporter [Gammaproteobacteria bacterium]MAY01357.1 Bcr/CflA family drug resistance efflux transporter [Gammaproteobacteria bacterium]|tara:strand:+ start:109432 stop:110649 length:1218 start_codon:yes stop_codon:yes gene_type:complete
MEKQRSPQQIKLSFVAMMAVLMSFIALSIDAMMPALGQIGSDLNVENPNDVQFVISFIFIGLALGIMFFGPFADSFGRKNAIYLGIGIFMIGCLASIFSTSFEIMLAGRVLQGFGASSCRVSTMCMIRDKYEGNAMAKVMSFIMIIFILSPALAPSLGQLVLFVASWRAIFIMMFIVGIAAVTWLALGQEETLAIEKRRPFRFAPILLAIKETLNNRIARGYTIASGLIFGAFVGYLNSAQQILQEQYALGDAFALAFGFLALSIGLASFGNSRWVYRYGMERICRQSLIVLVGISSVFLPLCLMFSGHPPLVMLMAYLFVAFFCCGLLFGNFNTMALHPLGHIAGAASSVIGSIQTLLSAGLGAFVGSRYNGTVTPLIMAFFILAIWSLFLVFRLTMQPELQES